MNDVNNEVLASVFASRVRLAKMDEEEAVEQCRKEWKATKSWIKSDATKEGSFLWFANEFDLDPWAVRNAIELKVK